MEGVLKSLMKRYANCHEVKRQVQNPFRSATPGSEALGKYWDGQRSLICNKLVRFATFDEPFKKDSSGCCHCSNSEQDVCLDVFELKAALELLVTL